MLYAPNYKQIALKSLDGKWGTAILTGFVASLIGGTIATTSSISFDSDKTLSFFDNLKGSEQLLLIRSILAALLTFFLIWTIITIVISGAAKLGYAIFNLKLIDKKDASFVDLFSQFRRLGDGFCMNFLMGLYVALWSMLFVIPGIIKQFSYAMTPYILAEHPGMHINEAITESRRIMDGNKWNLFCLNFSFIGWRLLCVLPTVFASVVLLKSTTQGFFAVGLLIFCVLLTVVGFILLCPYIEATQAAFYRNISDFNQSTDTVYAAL